MAEDANTLGTLVLFVVLGAGRNHQPQVLRIHVFWGWLPERYTKGILENQGAGDDRKSLIQNMVR
jgi:hypothetical protein